MRLTGVALFVLALAHFLIVHFLYDPAEQSATWIATVRWSSLFWRVFDWTLLMMVLFHAFLGVRTVVDRLRQGRRADRPAHGPLHPRASSSSRWARSS